MQRRRREEGKLAAACGEELKERNEDEEDGIRPRDTWVPWRSNTSVQGTIPRRGQVSTCLFTADKKREFLRHFHYELTCLILLLFYYPFFFY